MQATLKSINPSREQFTRRPAPALPVLRPDPRRVAVLLNRNARRVNDGLVRRFEEVAGEDNVFYSRTLEQAEGFAREIVQRGYGTVVCGGGDGTLARSVNLVQRYVQEANNWRSERYHRYGEWQSLIRAPHFGFLRLGTGNGMGHVVGSGDPLDDLKRIVGQETRGVHSIPLIDVGGESCFFAGLGYDSLILNDYNWLKGHTQSRWGRKLIQGLGGYLAAICSRSIPAIMMHDAAKIQARVKTRGPAYYIDPRHGDAVQELEPGTTLFEGTAGFLGVATTPFYGYGFKVYPFAGLMPGMMQLRIGQIGPLDILPHMMSAWNGSWRCPNKLFDFFVQDIDIELAQPYPFQHSGDAQGMRKNLRCRIADDALDLLDLHRSKRMFT